MPAKAFQCCCEGVCQERMARWHWGCTRPQTAGAGGKTNRSYLHNGHGNLTWRRFLPVPRSGNCLTLHEWGKPNQLSMWEEPWHAPPSHHSSALKVDLCSFCPRWNALSVHALGSEGKKHQFLWPIPQLEQVGERSIIPSFACKGQESVIRKGDNTGFSLGKRKVSCKAKLLSLLWMLHGTPLGCGLSPPIETCLFQSAVGFWEVL